MDKTFCVIFQECFLFLGLSSGIMFGGLCYRSGFVFIRRRMLMTAFKSRFRSFWPLATQFMHK